MRREAKKALGKTRGTSKERKERGETLSSPSQNAGDPDDGLGNVYGPKAPEGSKAKTETATERVE